MSNLLAIGNDTDPHLHLIWTRKKKKITHENLLSVLILASEKKKTKNTLNLFLFSEKGKALFLRLQMFNSI